MLSFALYQARKGFVLNLEQLNAHGFKNGEYFVSFIFYTI